MISFYFYSWPCAPLHARLAIILYCPAFGYLYSSAHTSIIQVPICVRFETSAVFLSDLPQSLSMKPAGYKNDFWVHTHRYCSVMEFLGGWPLYCNYATMHGQHLKNIIYIKILFNSCLKSLNMMILLWWCGNDDELSSSGCTLLTRRSDKVPSQHHTRASSRHLFLQSRKMLFSTFLVALARYSVLLLLQRRLKSQIHSVSQSVSLKILLNAII